MATQILARMVDDPTRYIIGDGDPHADPMMPAQVAVIGEGLYPAAPLQQHFKFGIWEDPVDAHDQKLIKKLLALPKRH